MQAKSQCKISLFSTGKKIMDLNEKLKKDDFKNIIINEATDVLINKLINNPKYFSFTNNFAITMTDTMISYADNCGCNIYDLFKMIVLNYSGKYTNKYRGKSNIVAREIFKKDFNNFNTYLQELLSDLKKLNQQKSKIKINLVKMTSIKEELNTLLPDTLGAMKDFFMTLIITYYDTIHPVIWCQIFAKICDNFFIFMPITKNEFYRFFAGQMLLNSGPVILKILQMMRPLLTPEIQQKYNLAKLTYPLLSTNQVNTILKKILIDIYDYKIMANLSASVGHVVILKKVDKIEPLIIKIIKPISIVQSCSEYNMLKNTFKKNSCEQKFIDNMIYAIGNELDATNEIQNIRKGYKYYTCNYYDIYGLETNHKLTTLQVLDNIIIPKCWYSLAVTLAKGASLSKLVEENIITKDTKYRASLHRCIDLLVYKFFFVLFNKGFYHGDLHAGNIFFSFKSKTLTLIDFGAVGNLDFFANDANVKIILEIIVMSIFFNYEEIMDKLTIFLNNRCNSLSNNNKKNNIDMTSKEYILLREKLISYAESNIKLYKINSDISKQNIQKIFSRERLDDEKYEVTEDTDITIGKNIYSYLDIPININEHIIENNEELRNLGLKNQDIFTINDILEILFKFYAKSGMNVAIQFNEIFEFQKAYALLLGVLVQVKYDFTRMTHAINKAILTCEHANKLFNITGVLNIINLYKIESDKYEKKRKDYK